jgi:uncharacterized protein with FMN-binding domain
VKSKRLTILLIIIIIIAVALAGCKLFFDRIEANLERLKEQRRANVDIANLSDGAYKGSYKSFPIEAEVEVIVEAQRIKAIELTKHKHGQGAAAETIVNTVVESQTLEVDLVAGATYSSKVILKAIENALIKAK